MKNKKIIRAQKRKTRVRSKMLGTKTVPRLSVHRSTKNIYVQIINDEKAQTLASYSTVQMEKMDIKGKTKSEVAKMVGIKIAELAKKAKISQVVFDRGSFRFQGRIKILASAAREAGLKF